MYRLLDRYILRETTGPLVLGLLVFTFLALMQELFQYAEMIIGRNVAAAVALKLLAYSLPHIVVLTIPMAFLFAILIAIGRLAADSELVAMRASGISLWAIYRPILFLSLVLDRCHRVSDDRHAACGQQGGQRTATLDPDAKRQPASEAEGVLRPSFRTACSMSSRRPRTRRGGEASSSPTRCRARNSR